MDGIAAEPDPSRQLQAKAGGVTPAGLFSLEMGRVAPERPTRVIASEAKQSKSPRGVHAVLEKRIELPSGKPLGPLTAAAIPRRSGQVW